MSVDSCVSSSSCGYVRMRRRHVTLSSMILLLQLVLPFGSPFGLASSPLNQLSRSQVSNSAYPSSSLSSSRTSSAIKSKVVPNDNKQSEQSEQSEEEEELIGENTASLPSRLLFKYASKLLDLASKERLSMDNALPMYESHHMESMVHNLEHIYQTRKDKARRKKEQMKAQGKETNTSDTILLAKVNTKTQHNITYHYMINQHKFNQSLLTQHSYLYSYIVSFVASKKYINYNSFFTVIKYQHSSITSSTCC